MPLSRNLHFAVHFGLQGFEILDQVLPLICRQVKIEVCIVVVDDCSKVWESPVVIETTFEACEKSVKWRRPITLIGRAAGLEIVDANLGRSVHVPPWLGKQWRNMASSALRFPA